MESFRKTVNEVLWNSYQEKRNESGMNSIGSLAGVTIIAVARKLRGNYSEGSFGNDVARFVVPEFNEFENLESRLHIASEKIQSMSYKELLCVLRTFRNHGLEYTIDYLLTKRIPVEIKS